jgi:AraC-like DNA-binding protein
MDRIARRTSDVHSPPIRGSPAAPAVGEGNGPMTAEVHRTHTTPSGDSTFVLLKLPTGVATELVEAPADRLPHLISSGRLAPAVLRRATAFIEEHSERPLTVGQIAAAAGVGIRGLQIAFRRHLEVTPMTYVRRVRLDRVHRELLTGDPHDGVTVQAVARRWGFVNLGRFAAEYRSEYGVPPSETLRA